MGLLDKSNLVKKSWVNFLEKKAKGIFCVSNLTKKQLLRYFKINCPIEVVHHSLNDVFIQKKVIIKNEPPRILFAARLEEFKGIYDFFKLAEYFKQINFTIIGKGHLENYVRKKCYLYPNVEYLGYIKDKSLLRDIYLSNNILLNLSQKVNSKKTKWEELFGISIIEAMASGICTIATSHPGPTEILTNEKNGFLVDENDIFNQTKSILQRLISDYDLLFNVRQESLIESKKYLKTVIYRNWEKVLNK
jgi:glycosyltransferase involved in cell wall biosynthesis